MVDSPLTYLRWRWIAASVLRAGAIVLALVTLMDALGLILGFGAVMSTASMGMQMRFTGDAPGGAMLWGLGLPILARLATAAILFYGADALSLAVIRVPKNRCPRCTVLFGRETPGHCPHCGLAISERPYDAGSSSHL